MYLFSKHFWTLCPNSFRDAPLHNLPNRRVACSNPSKNFFFQLLYENFLQFKPETIPTIYHFNAYVYQLRPMSLLSHTGDADSGQSWLVGFLLLVEKETSCLLHLLFSARILLVDIDEKRKHIYITDNRFPRKTAALTLHVVFLKGYFQ